MITMYFVYKGSQKESLESIVFDKELEIQYEQDKSKPYRAMMDNSSLTKEKLRRWGWATFQHFLCSRQCQIAVINASRKYMMIIIYTLTLTEFKNWQSIDWDRYRSCTILFLSYWNKQFLTLFFKNSQLLPFSYIRSPRCCLTVGSSMFYLVENE